MYAKASRTIACLLVGTAAFAGTLFTGTVVAKDKIVTVAIHVNSQGLDLRRPADAHTFYARLEHAAWLVCTGGTRVDLLPVDSQPVCYEKALGDAVRATNKLPITNIYLASHTPQEAAKHGIEVPWQVAAK